MNKIIKFLIFASFFLIISCKQRNEMKEDTIEIDFSKIENRSNLNEKKVSPKDFKVAISAITSPKEGLIFYKNLISFIEKKTNIQFTVIQRKTYQEINLMLRNNQVNLAFVCSGAYILEKEISNVEILVVPLTNGKPFYQAYIITNKNLNINKLEDFKGKSFAFTDPLSNTGRLYVISRLKEIGLNEKDFFSKTIYSNGHDTSIQLVSKNVVNGATIDGLIFEYIKKKNPKRVQNLKIIEKSADFGIPPIVVPANLDSELKLKIKTTLLNMHKDSLGKEILNNLFIDKFIEGNDSNYNSIRKMQKFVEE
jgi:phosphate/phosphite/phosphonate ABC transporter binding protein